MDMAGAGRDHFGAAGGNGVIGAEPSGSDAPNFSRKRSNSWLQSGRFGRTAHSRTAGRWGALVPNQSLNLSALGVAALPRSSLPRRVRGQRPRRSARAGQPRQVLARSLENATSNSEGSPNGVQKFTTATGTFPWAPRFGHRTRFRPPCWSSLTFFRESVDVFGPWQFPP